METPCSHLQLQGLRLPGRGWYSGLVGRVASSGGLMGRVATTWRCLLVLQQKS